MPSAKAVSGVKLHVPSFAALRRAISVLPSFKTTVAAASAVPAISGRVFAVAASGVMTGRFGAAKSIVTVAISEAWPEISFPRSVATAVNACTPSVNAGPTATDQSPAAEVSAVPSSVAPS